MKEQLEALAQEMIKEVKDLKDLTKKELPEIAKEYISYNRVYSGVVAIISGLVFGLSLISVIMAIFVLEKGSAEFAGAAGIIIGTISFLIFCINLSEYMSFKFQPRRMAIRAITSLFN